MIYLRGLQTASESFDKWLARLPCRIAYCVLTPNYCLYDEVKYNVILCCLILEQDIFRSSRMIYIYKLYSSKNNFIATFSIRQ